MNVFVLVVLCPTSLRTLSCMCLCVYAYPQAIVHSLFVSAVLVVRNCSEWFAQFPVNLFDDCFASSMCKVLSVTCISLCYLSNFVV